MGYLANKGHLSFNKAASVNPLNNEATNYSGLLSSQLNPETEAHLSVITRLGYSYVIECATSIRSGDLVLTNGTQRTTVSPDALQHGRFSSRTASLVLRGTGTREYLVLSAQEGSRTRWRLSSCRITPVKL